VWGDEIPLDRSLAKPTLPTVALADTHPPSDGLLLTARAADLLAEFVFERHSLAWREHGGSFGRSD
jgi:hypothetical protein